MRAAMNQKQYRDKYPDVAAALEEMILNDKRTHRDIASRYFGLLDKGYPRKLSLGVAITYLIENGYDVSIAIALKDLPQVVVRRGRPNKIKLINEKK